MRQPAPTTLKSPSRGVSLLLHTVGVASFANAYRFLVDMTATLNVPYIWHLQFLTIIGLLVSTVTFVTALIADIAVSRTLYRWKNILAVPSLALEVVITSLYWGMMAVNPKLLMADTDFVISKAADVSLHLLPMVFLLLDFFLLSPPSTHTPISASLTAGSIATGYWFWLEQTREWYGWYPYPFLNALSGTARLLVFLASSSIAAVTVMVLVWLRRNEVAKVVKATMDGNGKKAN